MTTAQPPLQISSFDFDRLERLLARVGATGATALLRAELDRAVVVEPEDLAPGVVTMNSQVRFSDEETGAESEVHLVFPAHADPEKQRVSILAPIGSALLGLSVGDRIEWPVPDGRTRQLRVVELVRQPEAEGDFRS
jgi:regulator of nucleoside diphosphate kinase